MMRSRFIAVVGVLFCCSLVFGDELQITSTPPGATVEIGGNVVGTTPCVSQALQ